MCLPCSKRDDSTRLAVDVLYGVPRSDKRHSGQPGQQSWLTDESCVTCPNCLRAEVEPRGELQLAEGLRAEAPPGGRGVISTVRVGPSPPGYRPCCRQTVPSRIRYVTSEFPAKVRKPACQHESFGIVHCSLPHWRLGPQSGVALTAAGRPFRSFGHRNPWVRCLHSAGNPVPGQSWTVPDGTHPEGADSRMRLRVGRTLLARGPVFTGFPPLEAPYCGMSTRVRFPSLAPNGGQETSAVQRFPEC